MRCQYNSSQGQLTLLVPIPHLPSQHQRLIIPSQPSALSLQCRMRTYLSFDEGRLRPIRYSACSARQIPRRGVLPDGEGEEEAKKSVPSERNNVLLRPWVPTRPQQYVTTCTCAIMLILYCQCALRVCTACAMSPYELVSAPTER